MIEVIACLIRDAYPPQGCGKGTLSALWCELYHIVWPKRVVLSDNGCVFSVLGKRRTNGQRPNKATAEKKRSSQRYIHLIFSCFSVKVAGTQTLYHWRKYLRASSPYWQLWVDHLVLENFVLFSGLKYSINTFCHFWLEKGNSIN